MIELTDRFANALAYAAEIHQSQERKSPASSMAREDLTPVSYMGHLLGVASIVIDVGGTEDEVIAALLHDAAEDQGGQTRLDDIHQKFGEVVARIVKGCSDSLVAKPKKKLAWLIRKERYIADLAECNDRSVFLVSAADKCQNARATARDLAFAKRLDDVWGMFSTSTDRVLWYFTTLIDVYDKGPHDGRRDLIVSDLRIAVKEMRAYAEPSDDDIIEDETPF